MKKLVLILFVTSLLLLNFQEVLLAQGGPPPEPDAIPFDGGLIALLLAIAGFFGGKKVFNKHKKKQ